MRRKPTLRTWSARLFLLTTGLFTIVAGLLFVALLRSLPITDGEHEARGLQAPARIERDAIGIPVIRAESLEDAALAQGFVHAQERFVQMDLARRFASGRLAELFGSAASEGDIAQRRYGFTRVADGVAESLPEHQRALLSAYTIGVNEGLRAMRAPHPEYLPAGIKAEPWAERDCILVALVMHQLLSFGEPLERRINVMDDALPADIVAFLTPHTTVLDEPVFDEPASPLVPMPTSIPEAIDEQETAHIVDRWPEYGSNNWVIGPSMTRDQRAIIANDMHLGLAVPNTWHRVEIRTPDITLAGVALPGMPGITQGTNTRIAWGFTNVTGDFMDLVRLRIDPDDDGRYLTPEGWKDFVTRQETVRVRGGEDREVAIRETRWGPVVDDLHDGTPAALVWAALDPATNNVNVLDLATANTVDDALGVIETWLGPPQNVVVADEAGDIAWIISGYLPKREGFTGKRSRDWSEPGVGWIEGTQLERPSLVNPPEGFIATANARTLRLDDAEAMGSNWASGARQRRIADLLRAGESFGERDMLGIQLDSDVTMIFEPIADAARSIDPGSSPRLERAIVLIEAWNGRADLDQPAMTILQAIRDELHDALIRHLVAPCRELDDGFRYVWFQSDEVLRRCLDERPDHLLPTEHDSWEAFIASSIETALDELEFAGRTDEQLAWGNARTSRISHPLSMIAPFLGALLDAPKDGLPGHPRAVRAQGSSFGASQRTVVSPGNEEDAILHMPTGQVLHPLSPHYMDMHRAWAEGQPTPLLAGPPVSTLTLVPSR